MKNSRLSRLFTTLLIGGLLGAATVSSCAGPDRIGHDSATSITITDFGVTTERMAWETWDFRGGAKYLKVDPSKPFRVTFVGYSRDYPTNLLHDDLALVGKDGNYYVFRASYDV